MFISPSDDDYWKGRRKRRERGDLAGLIREIVVERCRSRERIASLSPRGAQDKELLQLDALSAQQIRASGRAAMPHQGLAGDSSWWSGGGSGCSAAKRARTTSE